MQENQVWSLGWEDSLEKEMITHSSILASEIPVLRPDPFKQKLLPNKALSFDH